jgi:hypothetical protein
VTLDVAPPLRAEGDGARQRYEQLRDRYLDGSGDEADPHRECLSRLGLAGLFDLDPPRGYVAEVHEAKARGWGRVDPSDAALRDVVRLVLAPGGLVGPLQSSTGDDKRMRL